MGMQPAWMEKRHRADKLQYKAGVAPFSQAPYLLALTLLGALLHRAHGASAATAKLTNAIVCKYGQLPGRWVDAPPRKDSLEAEWLPSGKKQDWKLFDERCQLQPLANGALSMSKKRKGGRIPILFIGDSTDNLIIRDICNLGRDVGNFGEPVGYKQDHGSLDVLQVPKVDGYPRKFDCDFCSGCITNFATMGHTFIWGTSATGPYHLNRTDPWMDRIPKVVKEFNALAGQGPWMVVMNSNFWDLGTYSKKNASILAGDDFDEYVIKDYISQLGRIMDTIEKLVPAKTIKVYKTSAWPEPADCLGTGSIKTHLGKKSHVAQLNAAARYVATAFDWEIVDVEPMVAKFGHPSAYLRDNLHPHLFLNFEVYNIYLNILRDRIRTTSVQ